MSTSITDTKWLSDKIPVAWREELKEAFEKRWFSKLASSIRNAYRTSSVLPREQNIFRALQVSPDDVRVVIVGRDPYPQKENACGLAFSMPTISPLAKPTSSLKGIIKELENEKDPALIAHSYDLSEWAEQGVLLLNSTLTIEEGTTGSHEGLGWAHLTSRVLKVLDNRSPLPPVCLLWGCRARKKIVHLKRANKAGLVREAAHPCRPEFIGCNHFNFVNEILRDAGETQITW